MLSRIKDLAESRVAFAFETTLAGADPGETPLRQRDLGDVAGTWKADRDFDEAIADQDRIDERQRR